jgi:hypothetical protein
LEPFLGPSEFETSGERVVAGQRLMRGASDIFLGLHRGIGLEAVERNFFVRQLWDAVAGGRVAVIDG